MNQMKMETKQMKMVIQEVDKIDKLMDTREEINSFIQNGGHLENVVGYLPPTICQIEKMLCTQDEKYVFYSLYRASYSYGKNQTRKILLLEKAANLGLRE